MLNARQELRHAAHADRRLLRIAIQHSLASGFLAHWLATLPLARDNLLVLVRADNLHDCVRDLEEGGVDLLVCYTHPGLPLELSAERYPALTLAHDVLTPVSRAGADSRPLHALRPGASSAVPWLSYSADAQLGRMAHMRTPRRCWRRGARPAVEPRQRRQGGVHTDTRFDADHAIMSLSAAPAGALRAPSPSS